MGGRFDLTREYLAITLLFLHKRDPVVGTRPRHPAPSRPHTERDHSGNVDGIVRALRFARRAWGARKLLRDKALCSLKSLDGKAEKSRTQTTGVASKGMAPAAVIVVGSHRFAFHTSGAKSYLAGFGNIHSYTRGEINDAV